MRVRNTCQDPAIHLDCVVGMLTRRDMRNWTKLDTNTRTREKCATFMVNFINKIYIFLYTRMPYDSTASQNAFVILSIDSPAAIFSLLTKQVIRRIVDGTVEMCHTIHAHITMRNVLWKLCKSLDWRKKKPNEESVFQDGISLYKWLRVVNDISSNKIRIMPSCLNVDYFPTIFFFPSLFPSS